MSSPRVERTGEDRAERLAPPPLVSAITPTYNRAHVLLRAIRSVLDQDVPDLELLIIDDGSTDDTARIVAALTDRRLRYCRFETNRGIGAARHLGVARSRGRLIAFLDSDDAWRPGKLGKVVSAFARYPGVDLIFSDFEDINAIQKTREPGLVHTAPALRRLQVARLGDSWYGVEAGAAEALMRANFLGPSSTVVARRSVFETAGNFREDLSGPEDLEMWYRAAVSGARFAYTTEVLVERHKHGGSITAQKRVFATRRLAALDACEATARRANRPGLLRHVGAARSRTWCDLVEAGARDGRPGAAWSAFIRGLRYGVSVDACRYLVMALAGPRLVNLARRVKGVVGG
jgi:GT2 family glycosyltransferase